MKQDNRIINVFSTYTKDVILNQQGRVITEQRGGPLLFIENALKDTRANFKSFHNQDVTIEIRLTENGEVGKIVDLPTSATFPVNITGPVVISTVFNEWDLSSLKSDGNQVFVDIQGYIRDKKVPGKKHRSKMLENFANRAYCIKGTQEEISFLSPSTTEEQKKRLLITTHGADGVEFYSQNKRYFVDVKKKIKSKDTIGAGDTFFGYFVGSLYNTNSVENAITNSMGKTSDFLSQKELI